MILDPEASLHHEIPPLHQFCGLMSGSKQMVRWSNRLVSPTQKTRTCFKSSNLKARSYHLHHDHPVSKSSLERAITIDYSVCSYENCQRLRSQCQSNLRTVQPHVVNIKSCIFGPQSAPNPTNRYLHSEASSLALFRKMYQGQTAALISNTKNWCVSKGSEWAQGFLVSSLLP